jgi:DNA-binding response OmpR family regulator
MGSSVPSALVTPIRPNTGTDPRDAGTILLVHPDRKAQRTLHRILGATLMTVDAVDNVAQAEKLIVQRPPSLVVIDHRIMGAPDGQHFLSELSKRGVTSIVALMSEHDLNDLPQLLENGALTNLLGNPMPILAEELTVTALKLLRKDIFGLEKYMSWGIEARTIEIDNARQRSEVVDAITRDVREFGLGPRVASLATLVADELLSNALYNAPVDERGDHHRSNESRHSERELSGRDRIRARYACDARYLAIEVTDYFGSIGRQTILNYLAKCAHPGAADKVDFRRTGAGMGLGLVYGCCNHLVFNIDPGVRTEIIGLIDVRFKPAELGSLVSSFNVFVQAAAGAKSVGQGKP